MKLRTRQFHFTPQLHEDLLERPLLYRVLEEMTRATEMIFLRRMSGSALAEVLLTYD